MRLKNKGMTIVEILIASLLLSIILMGYIQTQMRSIINTEYSNKVNLVSSVSNDLSTFYTNFILSETDDTNKEDVINYFKNSNWTTNNYSSYLNDCEKEDDIDDVDVCDKEQMVHYIVKEYKQSIVETIPDALFNFDDCDTNDNLCLIVSWGETEPTEANCQISTSTCLILEIVK